MVEVEHDDVRLPAVNTRMRPKVLAQQAPIVLAIPLDPRDFLPDVGCAVPHVVPAPIHGVARTAATLPRAFGDVHESEVGEQLDETTVVAASSLRDLGKCERQRRTSRDSGRSFLRRVASRTSILSDSG